MSKYAIAFYDEERGWVEATLVEPELPELEERVQQAVSERYGDKPRTYHLGIMERKAFPIPPVIHQIIKEEMRDWGGANAFHMRGSAIINMTQEDKIEFCGDILLVMDDSADFGSDADMIEQFIEWVQDAYKPFPLLKERDEQ